VRTVVSRAATLRAAVATGPAVAAGGRMPARLPAALALRGAGRSRILAAVLALWVRPGVLVVRVLPAASVPVIVARPDHAGTLLHMINA
jgi:hypothetical protein